MKTVTAYLPQTSNGPLNAGQEKKADTVPQADLIQSQEISGNTTDKPAERIDIPENWDEAWFASYE